MSDIAIRVEGLSKLYRIGQRERYKTLRDILTDAMYAPFRAAASAAGRKLASISELSSNNSIWALKDVSFEVKRGEVVGIIGRNGAGKSTLLKILSRITEPTEGYAEVRGRVGSLLEVGTGFHPELTGRENIYLKGVILGMKKAEIRRKFDEIVGFAGVETFIDTPVKHYSSGMYVRLAFAVAAHLEMEILVVDEVLAVGDAAFQLKCFGKMSEFAGADKTILFVSHNMEAVTKLCGRGVLLEEGKIARIGTSEECVDQYLSAVKEQRILDAAGVSLRNHPGRTKPHNGPVRLTSLRVVDEDGKPTWNVSCGGQVTAVLGYELTEGSQPQVVTFGITFSNMYDHRIATCRSHDTCPETIRVDGSGEVTCRIPKLPLRSGSYKISVGSTTEAGFSDGVYNAALIEVTGNSFYPSGQLPHSGHGDVLFEHEWDVRDSSGVPRE